MRIDENGNKVISKSEFLHLKEIQASYKGYVECNDGVVWLVRSFKAMVGNQVTFNGPYSRFEQMPIVYYDIIIMHATPDGDDTNIIKYRGTNSDITGKYINNAKAEWYWSTSYPEDGLSYRQAVERNKEEWKSYRKNQHDAKIKEFKNLVRDGISKDGVRVLLATLAVPAAVIGGAYLSPGGIISTKFWGCKAVASITSQTMANKEKGISGIDWFDVATDTVLTSGASAYFGGFVDINYIPEEGVKVKTLLYNKEPSEIALDIAAGAVTTKAGNFGIKKIEPYCEGNILQENFFNTFILTTTSTTVGVTKNKFNGK